MVNLKVYSGVEILRSANKLYTEIDKNRNLYLKKVANGEIFGNLSGKPSLDKEWLRYYTDEQIMIDMPEMTIYNYMRKNNLNHLNSIALYYFGKRTTFEDFYKKIDDCAKGLVANGVTPGQIVTICMPNTPEAVIAFYALNKIGAVANMIHPLSGRDEIKYFINEVDSKLIIAIDSVVNQIVEIMDETKLQKIVSVSPKNSMPMIKQILYPLKAKKNKITNKENVIEWNKFIQDSLQVESKLINEYPYEQDRLAVILHTGGTSGTPKGVKLSNDNFNCMVEQFKQNTCDFSRGDRLLAIMPVFHGFGLCSSVHLPLSLGVEINLIPKLNKKDLYKIFKKYCPNHLIGVPTFFKAIIGDKRLKKIDMSYIKHIVSGGDKNSIENEVNSFFRLHNCFVKMSKGYGLSEAVAGITFAHGEYNDEESVGIPMVASNIKIVSCETNEELDNNEIGEIWIKGPSVMLGYYNNDKANSENFVNGWFKTGDMGFFKNGLLYFKQRRGNMIISSGVNVYPANIEKVIESHYAVASCAVIGINHPYKEQVPKAYVVLNEGYEYSEQLQKEIEYLCITKLNKYSIPYKYEFRELLPQTLLGKISHRELMEENNYFVKKLKTV
ncbi:MAG: class I adenylate-forming enzyme family protein [Bacilli bacterium]|nr:class I adenylate-forming enzyme family protein [Bacilli bacterium]